MSRGRLSPSDGASRPPSDTITPLRTSDEGRASPRERRPAAARCPTLHELHHLRSHEIRRRFLGFFEERGHHVLPNASLIPSDDPSLLFTVAGMVPLKRYISGERTRPARG